jgi:flagellar motility protein MotE (MotC chaperone)
MAFLSQLVGKPVFDSARFKLGVLSDMAVQADQQPYPQVSAIKVGGRWIGWDQVGGLGSQVSLRVPASELGDYQLHPHEVRLRDEVLDHQVLDLEGHRVRRVNDLALSATNGHYSLLGVDISTQGLLRRFGMHGIMDRLGLARAEQIIDWLDVDPVRSDNNIGVVLRRSRDSIARLHPSDLADIVEMLSVDQGLDFLSDMDEHDAADVLEEVEDERQVDLLERMESGRAAGILDEMAPDDAADVLADMEPAKAGEVMRLMDREEYADVAELLAYDENSAGGMMTTDYVAISEDLTAGQALDYIRGNCREIDMVYTLYLLGPNDRLVGASSLRDVIMADPGAPLSSFMRRDPPAVLASDNQEEVAQALAKYNLLAIPVVNDKGELQGIVTVDDAIDYLLPQGWKKRLMRMF